MCVFRRQEQNTGWKHTCGWFRRLTVEEKQALNQRFWAEGRLKLEPWLKPRIDHDPIKIWPTGMRVFTQIMGLLIAAIAVEFITQGLTAIFPGWQ